MLFLSRANNTPSLRRLLAAVHCRKAYNQPYICQLLESTSRNPCHQRCYTISTQESGDNDDNNASDDHSPQDHTQSSAHNNPKTKAVTLRLYRIVMRQVQALRKQAYDDGLILLQPPLDNNDSGKFRIFHGGGDGNEDNRVVSHHLPIDFLSIIEWFDERQRAHHRQQRLSRKQQQQNQPTSASFAPRVYQRGNVILAVFDLIPNKPTSGNNNNEKDEDNYDSDDEDNYLDSPTKRNGRPRPAKSWEYYLHPEWQGEHPTSGTTSTFLPMDEHCAVWCHVDALARAIRISFRHANVRDFPIVPDLHQRAISAYQILQHVQNTWSRTSVHTERNIRIACTSSCVARSYPSTIETALGGGGGNVKTAIAAPKYRYAYRIRIENLSTPSSGKTVQLLGRTWCIHQNTLADTHENLSTLKTDKDRDDHEDDRDDDVVRVVAPNTGVVGQLPVLSPGTVFEYQSGAEASARGRMEGCLHFCIVPDDTPSTTIGTAIPAFESDQRFSIPVKPFPLIADNSNMDNTET